MTSREFYTSVISYLNGGDIDNAAIQEFAQSKLAKMDAQNEKRRNTERKPTPKQIAAAEYDAKLMEAIGTVLTDEFQGRSVFAEALDVSPSKASTLLNKMVAAGSVIKGEVKGEKGKLVGYKRA